MMNIPPKVLVILLNLPLVVIGLVHFKPGSEYRYVFTGVTEIHDVKSFTVESRIEIIPLEKFANNSQYCELRVYNYVINTEVEDTVRQLDTQGFDFSKWCSFTITQNGQIEKVFTSKNEEPFILALKKTILGALSSRLLVSDSLHKSNHRWAYKAREVGHEGVHDSTYQAEPTGETISFTKYKHKPPMEGATHKYKKLISLNTQTDVPETSQVDEYFTTPKKSVAGYKSHVTGSHSGRQQQEDEEMVLPAMGGNSTMKLKLDRIVTSEMYLKRRQVQPEHLVESTLEIGEIPDVPIPLNTGIHWIKGNLTCAVSLKLKGAYKEMLPCFRSLQEVLKRLEPDDLKTVTHYYRKLSKRSPEKWITFINGLGAAKTNTTLDMLLKVTILEPDTEPKTLMNALMHFVRLKKCPSLMVLKTFEEKVFHNPWYFNDSLDTELVNERAELVLGSLVLTVRECQSEWAESVTSEIHAILGMHDPHHHRMKRQEMTAENFKTYVNKKTLHILTLGNGGMDSSRVYYESYLNSSESHLHLRSSAVEAVSKYQHIQAAEMLLKVIITDEDETIRKNARAAYERHPEGGDLTQYIHDEQVGYSNTTSLEHERIRRSIMDVLGRIWKGFHFHLSAPKYDWKKVIGGDNLGGSMGVFMENYFDVQIRPLSSSAKLSLHDKAWAMLHIGLVGFDFEIFRAELCYKGGIEYSLNILAENKFEEIVQLAKNLNKVIKKVVTTVRSTIKTFKEIIDIWKDFDIGDAFNDFINSVKEIPKKSIDFKKVARKLLKVIDEYVNMPPIINMIRNLVIYIKTFVTDVKSDVMTLYYAISDTVTTTLPWAWSQIKEAFNGIIDVFKSLVKNPTHVIQKMGTNIARITTAVGVLLDAKIRIDEANIFAKDQRPYWFDVKTIFNDLKTQLTNIKNEIMNPSQFNLIDPEENAEAKAFTGLDLKTMMKNALDDILNEVLMEIGEGPISQIQDFMSPFIKTYELFAGAVKNIKEAWRLLVDGYRTAKTQIRLIIGFKFHKDFPRKYLLSSTCGDGFWKSTGKGKYNHTGVALAVTSDKVIAPVDGYITQTGKTQITIKISELDETEIIIENVQLNDTINGTEVESGSEIGQVTKPHWCFDKHLHLSMRRVNGTQYINPAKYIGKRKLTPPKWVEHCDFYILKWLGVTIQQGSVTKGSNTTDETPKLPDAPSASQLEVPEITPKQEKTQPSGLSRSKEFLTKWVDNLKDFTQSLGLPSIENLKDVFLIKMRNITMLHLIDFMEKSGLTDLKKKLDNYIKKIQEKKVERTCERPSSMTDDELKFALSKAGKSTSGVRKTLERRYAASDEACYGIRNALGPDNWCTFGSACLSVSCCVNIKLFHLKYTIRAFIAVDPCSMSITFGINAWSKTLSLGTDMIADNFAEEGSEPVNDHRGYVEIAQLVVYYKVEKDERLLKVSFGVTFCSSYADVCKDIYMITKDALFTLIKCDEAMSATYHLLVTRKKRQAEELTVLLAQPVSEFLKNLDFLGLDEKDVDDIMEGITETFQKWLRNQIQKVMSAIFGNELESFDICMPAKPLEFGPYEVDIFTLNPPFMFQIGPVPCQFSFGIKGFYGATFNCELCLLSMKAKARIVPKVGSVVWGSLGVMFGTPALSLQANLRLTGYLLTTSFPTDIDISFKKFPIAIKAKMDLVLRPLEITMRAILKVKLGVNDAILLDKLIWNYHSSAIVRTLFDVNTAEEDKTPPVFDTYPESPKVADQNNKTLTITSRTQCTIYQLPNKDYTEPEFFLGVGVSDDKSNVEKTYCIGTYMGGCNVVRDEAFGGDSILQRRKMKSGVPLFATITARNTQGSAAEAYCTLPTYDVTPPQGVISPQGLRTSHPEKLRVVLNVLDDTPIIKAMVSIGYGTHQYGNQLQDWQEISLDRKRAASSGTLYHFTNPVKGQLLLKSYYTLSHTTAEICAKYCLIFNKVIGCKSFQLEEDTCYIKKYRAAEYILFPAETFYYEMITDDEKRRILFFDNLSMVSTNIVYINMHLQNSLNYTQYVSSPGIIVDFTTPEPGHISSASLDVTKNEKCTNFAPDEWKYLCSDSLSRRNYRYITDGPGSRTVFIGNIPFTDTPYSRSTKFITGQWHGFNDKETGILLYIFSLDKEYCTYSTPYGGSKLQQAAELPSINMAHIVFSQMLEDGKYYLSVTALNDIQFGGPLAVTVCHSLPFIIDTTDPVLEITSGAQYNQTMEMIQIEIHAYDHMSGIKRIEIGLGRSVRDTYLVDWTEVMSTDNKHIQFPATLPDGIPAWLKVRVTNNVNLRTTGHSPNSVFTDSSGPVAGVVYSGTRRGTQLHYQSNLNSICVNWQNFHDADTGIDSYFIAVGSAIELTDVQEYIRLPGNTHGHCTDALNLEHSCIYYVTVVAQNGAPKAQNASAAVSITIDNTPPFPGWINHGVSDAFSSSISTIQATWGNFSDLESGLSSVEVYFYRKPKGSNAQKLIYTETDIPPSMSTIVKHHFHLKDGDTVNVAVVMNNNAGLSSRIESPGYKIDSSGPVVMLLIDGYNVTMDQSFTETNNISVSWQIEDTESGIEHIELAIYKTSNGIDKKIYPVSNKTIILPPSLYTYITPVGLPLQLGSHVFTRLYATNYAGKVTVCDTDGIIYDNNPPTMIYVHAGVQNGETEEIIDGFVHINSKDSITGSWKAIDYESQIAGYMVGVGSMRGKDDLVSFRLHSDDNIGEVKVSLNETDTMFGLPVYYLSVFAVNRAGVRSNVMSSSPFKVILESCTVGNVWDGAKSMVYDIDVQSDDILATVRFDGFSCWSEHILYYEWAIGTHPKLDDIKHYSMQGVITKYRNGIETGVGQVPLLMTHGTKYYSTIRAITKSRRILESSSDGFIVDTSPPVIIDKLGSVANMNEFPINYQRNGEEVDVSWTVYDDESGIHDKSVFVGTYPGGNDILLSRELESSSIPIGMFKPNITGRPYFISVNGENMAGLSTTVTLLPTISDKTPPVSGSINCTITTIRKTLTCSWDYFRDDESEISKYMIGVGITEGEANVVPFREINRDERTISFIESSGVNFSQYKRYYVTIKAINGVNMDKIVYSAPVIVDTTPPMTGWISELQDFTVWKGESTHVSVLQINDTLDVVCQKDLNQLEVSWQPFNDEETGIDMYEIGLGSTPGQTDLNPFVRLCPSKHHYLFNNLDLYSVRQAFVILKGYNRAGLSSFVISNGVYISRYSAGLTPLKSLIIMDGLGETDIDYQNNRETISARWDFSGDPCPIVDYEWSITRFDGSIKLPMTKIPKGEHYGIADELHLVDKEAYFVTVKATNALGYVTIIHSDGITISMEPITPGIVRDGAFVGLDMQFQTSLTELSANWDGFGNDKYTGTIGEIAVDYETIAYYEVAAGTDLKYANTRNNVHHFVNVGPNKTYTFTNLEINQIGYYYITVRAHSVSSAITEISSDGVHVINETGLISAGNLNMQRYISSTNELYFEWTEFHFHHDVVMYYWEVLEGNATQVVVNCEDLNVAHKEVLKKNGLDTQVETTNVTFKHSHTYTVYVIAVDEAGVCGMSSGAFTVDTTPAVTGSITVDSMTTLDIMYAPFPNELSVWWSGFFDDESGIKTYTITLYNGTHCSTDILDMSIVRRDNIIETSASEFKFQEIELDATQFYLVEFEVENYAGLFTTVVSKTIVPDFISPTSGKVVDGLDFKKDIQYHFSRNKVYGTILFMPNKNADKCRFRTFDEEDMKRTFTEIIHKGMWLLPEGKKEEIVFLDSQIKYNEQNAIEISLTRDVTKNQMLSGAVAAKSDIFSDAKYEFEIKPATDFEAVTSVTFWEGSPGILVTFGQQEGNTNTTGDYLNGRLAPLKDDTFPSEYSDRSRSGKGFGIELIPDTNVLAIIMWMSDGQMSRTLPLTVDLDFNVWHTYMVSIDDGGDNSEDGWNVNLFIDGEKLGEMGGVFELSTEAYIILGVSTLAEELPQVLNIFQPPSTKSLIKILRFPSSSDRLCRYGDPFTVADNTVVKFYAGIGSERNSHDIIDFQEVNSPCVPCNARCDMLQCDKSCSTKYEQVINIALENISLNPYENSSVVNGSTVLKSYYLVVKMVTGSGKETITSSNGFNIIEKAPVIHKIYHLDSQWSLDEPVIYQGNKDTIAVAWEASDQLTEITKYKWAIGSSQGEQDIQKFLSTGTVSEANNGNLLSLLKDNHTYYVTVQAYNEAGLMSQTVSSGVTIMTTPPSLGSSKVTVPDSQPVRKKSLKKVKRSLNFADMNPVYITDQHKVSCTWNLNAAQHIDKIYAGIGTDRTKSDIFSDIWVGTKDSVKGVLNLSSFGAYLNDQSLGNFSGFNNIPTTSLESYFLLERGRNLICNVKACSLGHLCTNVASGSIVIIGQNDIIETTDLSGLIIIRENINGNTIHIETANAQPPNTYLTFGILNQSDFSKEYHSTASSDFVSFMVNPDNTVLKTERMLYKCWQVITNVSFYLGTLMEMEISGPVTASVSFKDYAEFNIDHDHEPKLVTWCPTEQVWVDASRTCSHLTYRSDIDWDSKLLTINICNIEKHCASNDQIHRKPRELDENNSFSKSRVFVLGGFNKTYVNYPPFITSQTEYDIYEDPGTITVMITAEDPENDDFEFYLDNTHPSNGSANLSTDGILSYIPCEDCFGSDEIHYDVTEKQPYSKMRTLNTHGVVKFKITSVNDNPSIIVIDKGSVLEHVNNALTVNVDNNIPVQDQHNDLLILLSAFDADGHSLNMHYQTPKYGMFKLENQRETKAIRSVDCSHPWINQSIIWNEELGKFYSMQEFAMPLPCRLNKVVSRGHVNWMLVSLRYTPQVGFIGKDTIKVYAADAYGKPSYVTEINVYVLANPCWHNASCYKPVTDQMCTGLQRSRGFDGYYCNCSLGFTGVHCETNIDDCASNPCEEDHTCVDSVGNYDCQCLPGLSCDEPSADTLMLTVVSVMTAVVIIVLASLLIWWLLHKKGLCATKSVDDVNSIRKLKQTNTKLSTGRRIRVTDNFKMWAVRSENASNMPQLVTQGKVENKVCPGVLEDGSYSDCDEESRPITASSVHPAVTSSNQNSINQISIGEGNCTGDKSQMEGVHEVHENVDVSSGPNGKKKGKLMELERI